MPRIKTYKNSKFSTALSFIGYCIIACAVYAIFNDAVVGGIIALIVGFGVKFLAAFISQRKQAKDDQFKQWMKS